MNILYVTDFFDKKKSQDFKILNLNDNKNVKSISILTNNKSKSKGKITSNEKPEKINFKYIPFLNIKLLKRISLIICSLFMILSWCLKNYNRKSILILNDFNILPSSIIYFVSKLFNIKTIKICNQEGINDKNINNYFVDAYVLPSKNKYLFNLIEKNNDSVEKNGVTLEDIVEKIDAKQKNSIPINKILYYSIVLLCLILVSYGFILYNYNLCIISLMLYFLTITIISLISYREYTPFLFFLLTFFTFTMGQYIFNNINNDFMFFEYFPNKIICKTIFIQIVALYFSFTGYNIVLKNKFFIKLKLKDKYDSKKAKELFKKIIFIGLVVSMASSILVNIEKDIYSIKYGYLSLYNGSIVSVFPQIVVRLSSYYFIFFAFYISLTNDKKHIIISIIFFLINGITNFIAGGRAELITCVLFIIFYYLMYHINNNISISKRVKKLAIVCIIMVPLILTCLNSYNYIRNHKKVPEINFLEQIPSFFSTQSRSVNLINYALIYEDKLTEGNHQYVFGFLKQDLELELKILSLGLIKPFDFTNTKINLGEEISNIVLGKNLVKQGNGLGSQYLAEIYIEGNLIGVILYSVLLGMLISFFYRYSSNFICKFFSFSLFNSLITTPRGMAYELFAPFCSSVTITLILIYLLLKWIYKNQLKNVSR